MPTVNIVKTCIINKRNGVITHNKEVYYKRITSLQNRYQLLQIVSGGKIMHAKNKFLNKKSNWYQSVDLLVNNFMYLLPPDNYYYQLSIVSDDDFRLIFSTVFFFRFLNRYRQLCKGMFMAPRFLLIMSLYLSSVLPVLRDPSLCWE